MADDYDPDYDGDYIDFDDGWMYVEDEYGLADELAESQIPEPGYSGTANEIEMESYEYDFYAFWDDLEYADDAYWDSGGRAPRTSPAVEAPGQKRKRGTPGKIAAVDKRRKVSATQRAGGGLEDTQMENVVYMSAEERCRLAMRPPPLLKSKSAAAFLADWRQRFAGKDGEVLVASMPADMQRAAQAKDEDAPGEEGDEEDWEDEHEGGLDDEAEAEGVQTSLDPEMLKAILKQKFGEAGLEGMDEGAFMAAIGKMLAGEETEDDAMGDLAGMLLGKATADGGDEKLEGWLKGQGVELAEDDEDDAPSVDASTVGAGPSTGRTTQMAMRNGSPGTTAKKGNKRKKVTFDVPQEESSAEHVEEQQEVEQDEPLITKPSNEDVVGAESTAAPAGQNKATESTPARKTRSKRTTATETRVTPDEQLQHELSGEVETPNVDAAKDEAATKPTTRQTRKRKAAGELAVDGDGDPAGAANGRPVKEAATRRTRSARAKGGK